VANKRLQWKALKRRRAPEFVWAALDCPNEYEVLPLPVRQGFNGSERIFISGKKPQHDVTFVLPDRFYKFSTVTHQSEGLQTLIEK
jgi:hypothetical protein